MTDKKFSIESGGKIDIEIPRSKKPEKKPFTGHLSAKGLFGIRREEEYLARRLKKKGFINFYDLGYYSVADYYEYFPQLSNGNFTFFPEAGVERSYNFTEYAANFEEIIEQIFETPLEEFAAHFFKIYKGTPDFEKTIKVAYSGTAENSLDNVSEWKEGGLQLSDEQLASLVVKPLDLLFSADVLNLGTMENLKATLTRDYAADAVEFAPGKTMDVYLMPTQVANELVTFYKSGLVNTGTFTDYVYFEEYLNTSVQTFPREVVLGQYHEYRANYDSMNDYQRNYAEGQLMKLFDHTRAFRFVKTPSGGSYTLSFGAIDAGEMPNADIYTPTAPLDLGDAFSLFFDAGLFSIAFAVEAARLKAVIKKDNIFYYIWKTD